MKTTILRIAAAVALALLSVSASAQQGKPMEELLKPWLDLSFTKETGTDSNVKELVATVTPEIQAAVPAKLSFPIRKRHQVLIVTEDTLGALHAPGAAGLLVLLREAGQKFGDAFAFTEVYSAKELDAAALAKYDAVVLNSISQLWGGKGAEFYNQTLPEYVRNGGGLLATHGTALLFRKEPQAPFNTLLGGFTTENPVHPGKQGMPFPVKIDEPNHPLTAAFRGPVQEVNTQGQWLSDAKRMIVKMQYTAPAQLADELYTFNPASNADSASRALVSIDHVKMAGHPGPEYPEGTPEFGYALVWIKSYGNGRVFYSQFGHNFSVFGVRCVAQSVLDGLEYVTGDLPVTEENRQTSKKRINTNMKAERFVWRARLLPGMKEEYVRRHREVWPEMTALLNAAGIHNYSIWLSGDDIFGYFEAAQGVAHARQLQQASPVYHRWAESMKNVMTVVRDPQTGAPFGLEEVFYHP